MFDSKKWREKNKKHLKEYYRDWYKKNGRIRPTYYKDAIREWEKKNPEAKKAHGKLIYAIRAGKIIKPKECSICGRVTRLSGHHRDYSKPLDVLWLCSSCHKLEHSKKEVE